MPSLKKINVFSRSRSKEKHLSIQKSPPSVVIKSHNSNFEGELPPLAISVKNYLKKNDIRSGSRSAAGTTKSLPSDDIKENQRNVPRSILRPQRATSVPRKLSSSNTSQSSSGLLSKPDSLISLGFNPLTIPQEKKGRPRSYHESEEKFSEVDFTCAICLEILHRPRELLCGHAFCLLCLQNYSNSCSSNFSCPSCRQLVKLPVNGVSDLKRNIKLERMTEKLAKKQNQMSNTAKICYQCQSEELVTECHHCHKGWCQFCSVTHAEEVKKDFISLKSRLTEVKWTLKCRKEEEEVRYQRLEKKVADAIEFKIDELVNKKESLCTEIEKLKCRTFQRLDEHLDKVDSALSESFPMDSTQNISVEDISGQMTSLNQILKSSGVKFSRITFDSLSLVINSTDEEDVSIGEGEGRGQVSRKSSSNTLGEDSQDCKDEEQEEQTLILPQGQSSLYRKKSSYSKRKWGHHICERPAGVAISPWNSFIYVTGSDACKVYIYDQGGKQIGSFGSRGHSDGQFLCPIGVAFSVVNNELYITDKWKHCIHVFDSDGNFIRQLGKKGKGLGQFSSPEGVATDRNGNIFIADTCNDRVQVLDSEGVYLKEIGIVSSELVGNGKRYTKREFSEPVGVAVNSEGSRIYVADSGNNRIRVFDSDTGQRILMFGSRGTNKGQFESPESLTIDSEGFIIVGDSGNGRVQIFRPNGHFVRFLGAKSKRKGEFGWVSGVTIADNNDIIVTDFKNNSLAVF